MKNRLAALLAFLLLLAVSPFFRVARAENARDVLLNERITVPADGREHAFIFVPTANNLYSIRAFGEGRARALLYLEGEEEPIASGEGEDIVMEVRLIADRTYRLVASSQDADVEFDLMRATLARSFDQPLDLNPDGLYDKALTRAYDTHWFRFVARKTGLYVIRTQSEMNTVGYLLDESGSKIAMNDNLYSPYGLDFRIQWMLEAGKTYYVRVSGRGEEIGAYRLVVAEPGDGEVVPETLSLSEEEMVLGEGESARISFHLAPENALKDVVWISSRPEVASVAQDGEVIARGAGEAQIICSGAGGAQARCEVIVQGVPVTGIRLEAEEYTLGMGESFEIPVSVLPENASNRTVRFVSSDPGVVSVGRRGQFTGLSQGEAVVTVTTREGGFQASVRVTVTRAPSTYRALVMGVQRYEGGRTRLGATNTTQGIGDLFAQQDYSAGRCEVTMRLDMTRAQAVSEIRKAFEGARPGDVSLLYVNTHGGFTGGQPWLEFSDGKRLTGAQLERELRKVKGTVVLLIDCCQSGSFLSGAEAAAFNRQMVSVFASGSNSRLASSKYRILTSASPSQDSYRRIADTESMTATLFARGLCEAGGWDLMGDKKARMRGDINRDQVVSLYEAYLYAGRRVRYYLNGEPVNQDVQIFPMGSGFALFQRSS